MIGAHPRHTVRPDTAEAARVPEGVRPGPTFLVVLAGGRGERFRGTTHKLDAPLTLDGVGMTVAQHSVAHALATGRPTIVVTGAVACDLSPFTNVLVTDSSLGPAWDSHHDQAEGQLLVVHNPFWAQGQATSLHAAITAAAEFGAEAVVVGLADQPFVQPETWEALALATGPIAVATYHGQRRNPVRLERSIWGELPTQGDVGARRLFEQWPERLVEVPCTGSPDDIDTLEELLAWQNRSSTNSP